MDSSMPSPFTLRAEGGLHAIDRAEVLRALTILIDPGQTFELRALPSGRSRICRGNDLESAVEAAWELSDEKGLYWCLNPVRHDLIGAASNKDILSRRWLLIDVDTQRTDKDSNATNEEKIAAIKVVDAVLDYLVDLLGWPHPLVVDSGNGWHLLFRIDLEIDKLSQQLLKEFLARLADKFDTAETKIDRAVHNAARISKLPGSWARKGPNSEDRPHRFSRLLMSETSVVSFEQIKAVNEALSPHGQAQTNTSPFNQSAYNGKGLESYVRSAIERECGRLMMTFKDRNIQLNASAFSLGQFASWPECNQALVRGLLKRAALQCGLGESETDKTIESGWNAGSLQPRERPIDPRVNGQANVLVSSRIIWAKDIKTRKVQWLWPGRIPLGKMTTFAGQTGMGKTFTMCDIAARITRGAEIPFGGGTCFRKGKVLFISAEDDADDTLVPRFLELDGDPNLLAVMSPEAEENFSLAALELLNACLGDMGDGVVLIAIDPPTSYVGKVDDHNNAQLRGLLGPLKRFCSHWMTTMLFGTHVNKAMAANVEAMARVIGSVAWVAGVRSAHMFCPDPDDKDSSLFIPLKVNNGPRPKGLAYRIENTPSEAGKLIWTGEDDRSADEAMGSVKKKSRGVCAVEWLTARFHECSQWESEELVKAAREAGISRSALWSPEANALPLNRRKRVNAAGEPCWMWIAEAGWPKLETIEPVETLGDKPAY
jgi:hypothetical protein